jgi:3-oxoacyl-[acyl-carrier-protein] synthase II
MLACHISILMDCQGPSNTITEADASSNLAIAEAARIIGRGKADVMITGGADSKVHPLSLTRLALYGAMSRWEGEPEGACRPFDSRRDGSVGGEGAGILVLEEREHALRRGATIHGEILGSGSGCDAMPSGGLDPDGRGTAVAIKAALHEARIDPGDVGHVNAHGVGSKLGDLAEARALHRVFGDRPPPVSALKGFIGNVSSGAGAVELIASLVGVNRGFIPPTLNCDDPDPECALDVVTGAPRPTENPVFVNTNFTTNGQADASSNLAIAEAARIIGRGKADVMITGGADSKVHPLSLTRLALYGAMSRWEGEPEGACRPFDSRRAAGSP